MNSEIWNLVVYFFIYSFIGWVLESTYKSILQKRIVNSGFLLGPFCPIYGFGALIMYLSLKDVTNNIFILFVFGLVILSLFEYVVGLFLEVVFKTKYWDYSKQKFNIQGRVCLKNSLYWGVLGIIFMKVIHPEVERLVRLVPSMYMVISIVALVLIMTADTVTTIVRLVRINIKLKNWSAITENIRSKIDAINDKAAVQFANVKRLKFEHDYKFMKRMIEKKDINKLLGELKQEQQQLQHKLERRLDRLRRAFPTMNSDKLTNFLNNMKKS